VPFSGKKPVYAVWGAPSACRKIPCSGERRQKLPSRAGPCQPDRQWRQKYALVRPGGGGTETTPAACESSGKRIVQDTASRPRGREARPASPPRPETVSDPQTPPDKGWQRSYDNVRLGLPGSALLYVRFLPSQSPSKASIPAITVSTLMVALQASSLSHLVRKHFVQCMEDWITTCCLPRGPLPLPSLAR